MKKPLILFLILVLIISLGYVGDWAISQPIMSSYDPTAVHWASTHVAGDILYNDASTNDGRSWVVLNKGTALQALLMNAGATAPEWTTLTLTTHTSGNYVKSITNGTGITGGDGGSEGAALTIAATLGTAITGDEITDADYGDFTFLTGSATLDTGVVADNEIDYANVTLADFDYQGNYKTFYTDGSGDVQELANGTNTWILTSQGTGTAPAWAVAAGAVEDDAYGAGWNGDTANAPSQNAVYDRIHLYDTDDDGDIDSVDAGLGSGDIQAVGDGLIGSVFTAAGSGTTLYFEGATDDGEEVIFTTADPATTCTVTMRAATGTVIISGDTFTGDVTATLDTDGSTALTVTADNLDFTEFVDSMTLDASTTINTDDKTLIIQASSTQTLDIFAIKLSTGSNVLQVENSGSIDLFHTAVANDEHHLELDTDAAGFGDIKSIDIDYITGGISAGEDEGIVLINIDETLATGGDVFAYEVLATDGNAAIYGLKVGALVGPIHQDSGTFANPTTGTDNTISTDVAAMIDGATNTTTAIFENDNEYILIGAATAFEEIEFILTTGSSGAGIAPTFGYSVSGSHTYTTFSPVDGTNGFKNTGVIAWDASDLTSHVANDETTTFDIIVTRTKNSLGTTPILGYMKIASTTEYVWDEDGDVNIKDLTASGIVEGATLTEGGVGVLNSTELSQWTGSASITTLGTIGAGTWAVADSIELATSTTATNWVTFYSDGSGDVQELSNGTNTWVLTSQGTGTAPAWAVGGTTAWDDIGDADAAGSIDFVTHTQTIDIGVTDTGGPKSGLILDVTGLGAGVTDVIALEITTAADFDTDFIPIEVRNNSGVDNDLLFQVSAYGKVTMFGGVELVFGSTIHQPSDNSVVFTENSDSFTMYYGGTDCDFIWSDGALNLRNAEDGTDAIVEIEGKDAGEKGILRVLSDGDDKYIELYHDDTDAIISSSSGSINLASQTLNMPKRTKNDDRFYTFNLFNPNSLYDTDTQVCFEPNLPAAITITEVTVTCDADPATELDIDLKWANAFIGLASATLIEPIDTTNGTTDIDSNFDDATVAAGKCLYVEFGADPISAIKQAIVKVRYDYD